MPTNIASGFPGTSCRTGERCLEIQDTPEELLRPRDVGTCPDELIPEGCPVQIASSHVLTFISHAYWQLTSKFEPSQPPLLPAGTSELRVDLVDFDGNKNFAKYSSFQILGEEEKYKLILGDFVGGGAGKKLSLGGAVCEVGDGF